MATIDDLRRIALDLPEAEEGTHFGLVSFKVHDTGFVGLLKSETHALASVPKAEAEDLAADDPATFEPVWRNDGAIFVGVRVGLDRIAAERLAEVVGHAWRHRAPKRLVAAHPQVGDGLPVGLSAPAKRALVSAGYTTLSDLTGATEEEVAGLHGVGPSAIRHLRRVLAWTGRSFAAP